MNSQINEFGDVSTDMQAFTLMSYSFINKMKKINNSMHNLLRFYCKKIVSMYREFQMHIYLCLVHVYWWIKHCNS